MTNSKENSVTDNCNAVSVRSEADSNRCTRFCRPLPSHSAIRPKISDAETDGRKACAPPRLNDRTKNPGALRLPYRECKYTNNSAKSKTFAKKGKYIFGNGANSVPLRKRSAAAETETAPKRNRTNRPTAGTQKKRHRTETASIPKQPTARPDGDRPQVGPKNPVGRPCRQTDRNHCHERTRNENTP